MTIPGQQITTVTISSQAATPSTSVAVPSAIDVFEKPGDFGFTETAVVTLSSAVYGTQSATISAIDVSTDPGAIVFTSAVSAEAGDIITKDYKSVHGTQAEATRKRHLGII